MLIILPLSRIPTSPKPAAVPSLWNDTYDEIDDRLQILNEGKKDAISTGSQQITETGNFIVPDGIIRLAVSLVGGGGGGAGSLSFAPYAGGGGGSGQVKYRQTITVTPGQSILVTIGAGGAGGSGSYHSSAPTIPTGATYSNSNGMTGEISSFGTFASAVGGGGGSCQAAYARGGISSASGFCGPGMSGDILATTQTESGGFGGGNIFSATSPSGHDGAAGILYGGGGGGGRATGYWFQGHAGAPGLCIVEW